MRTLKGHAIRNMPDTPLGDQVYDKMHAACLMQKPFSSQICREINALIMVTNLFILECAVYRVYGN